MILPIWKRLSIALSVSLLLVSCGGQAGNVKVYSIDPNKGLIRKQENEVLAFEKAKGYLCETPDDFRDTVTCTGGAVKVYKLNPERGLVRSQAGEVIPFIRAKGYLCTSPRDFKAILDECAKPSQASED